MSSGINRRSFLSGSGAVLAGVVALVSIPGCSRQNTEELARALGPSINPPEHDSGLAWVRIDGEGRCKMFCPRMEMGQNANTGLLQIVAEELNLGVEEIEVEHPNTSQVPPIAFTAGSLSLAWFAEPMARAAAGLREHLRSRAASKFQVSLDAVEDRKGGFADGDDRFLSFADLALGTPVILGEDDLLNNELYSFEPGRKHNQIGGDPEFIGLRDIVTGAPIFSADIKPGDALCGRVVRPPARNATLAKLDGRNAENVPGFVQLVESDDGFVGCVCETPRSLNMAMEALIVEWKSPLSLSQKAMEDQLDIDRAMQAGDFMHQLSGDSLQSQNWDIDLRYDVQLQSHAMQEPRAAVAEYGEGPDGFELRIWTGTQDLFAIKRHAALDLGIEEEKIIVSPMRMGGGFGGREHYDVERDAARLSKAVKRPVKVQWTREDEFRAARHRSPSSHRVRVSTDSNGNILEWHHAFVSGYTFLARGRLPDWHLDEARKVIDLGVERGAVSPYQSSRSRIEFNSVDLAVDLGTFRSLGATPNIFAIESTVDELARKTGSDPVQFRLDQLGSEKRRLAECLMRVRELSAAKKLPSGSDLYGRGFACGIYDERTFVAISADVAVDRDTGAVSVIRMCCSQDAGKIVNPDQVRAQVEGNLFWGIGMALLEKIEMADTGVAAQNFHEYFIPRMEHAPDIVIDLIDQETIRPAGVGESALVAGPAAIANAVRDATGLRITKLPIEVPVQSLPTA